MALERVTFGVVYDGVDLVTEGGGGEPRLTFRVVRGLDDSPEVRGSDTVIPQAAGRVPRARVWDRRVIELRGTVMAVGTGEEAQRTDIRDALDALQVLFDPTRAAATLTVYMEDGTTTKTISARPLPGMLMGDEVVPTYREVSVELEAVEADWDSGSGVGS